MEVDSRRKTCVTFSAEFNGRTDGRTDERTDGRTDGIFAEILATNRSQEISSTGDIFKIISLNKLLELKISAALKRFACTGQMDKTERIQQHIILDSNTYYAFSENLTEFREKFCHKFDLFVRLAVRSGFKVGQIDREFNEDSHASNIVKIGAIQNQFGPFF